jgi:histidyl-tRNA synthetase
MADQLLKELGISGVTLHLNTLGDGTTRAAWRAALIDYFGKVRGDLSEDSQERLDKNPLRILDSKDRRDQAFLADAPKIDAFLSDEAGAFFESVTSGLDAAGVAWTRAENLVRGLDYYRHTAFEFIPDEGSAAAEALGAQSTILGGGRYDGLMESLGGPATPAVGWAAGIERLAMASSRGQGSRTDFVLVPIGDEAFAYCTGLIATLRRKGLYCDMAFRGNPKKRMQKADAIGASAVLLVGAEELSNETITVKNLLTGEQNSRPRKEIEASYNGATYTSVYILGGPEGVEEGYKRGRIERKP